MSSGSADSAGRGSADAAARGRATSGDRRHYSYSVYANSRTADTFDERRFGGPIGALVAESQEHAILDPLPPVAGLRILDVGTGTGRAAMALARRGALVTAVDASREMLRVAERRAAAEDLPIRFALADAHSLAFPDRAFDVVVCLRVLIHAVDWPGSLRELARVSGRHLVIDYARRSSLARLQSAWKRAAWALGISGVPYRVISDAAIARELEKSGFRPMATHRQFVLPIALHKGIASRAFTEGIERRLTAAGLNTRFASPVTIVAERCAF
jgi:ubiquinone/menaquinone biosynthesis C-methylase UbiE